MRTPQCIKASIFLFLLLFAVLMFPATANAQSLYGQRLQGANGWLLPVASRLLCSDSAMHVRRGSIPSWDICTPQGSAIYPTAPGRVIYAGCNNAGGYGCWVKLDHGGGITSAYAHMVSGSITVQTGQAVTQDMVIGQVGWTGMTSFGPHVHFVIYQNGAHVDPAQVFSQQAMQFCDKCASPGDAPVVAAGTVQADGMALPQQQVTSPGLRFLSVVVAGAADAGAVGLFWLLVGSTFTLLMVLWLSPGWLRVMLSAGIVAAVCAFVVVLMFSPRATNAAGGDWQMAFAITAKEEGCSNTWDGAVTRCGITQATYDRWRRAKGLPLASVQQSLTKAERQQIYYDIFWMPAKADQMPFLFAVTYVDHMFNTGDAKPGLAQCGFDAKCFNDWRVQDYLSMSTCFEYCRGWLNRVENIRSITEVKQ